MSSPVSGGTAPTRWSPGRIVAAWCGYWLVLVLAFVAPLLPTLWRVTRPDAKGSVSVSFSNDAITVAASQGTDVMMASKVSLVALSLWFVVPPLVMLGVIMWSQRRRRANAREAEKV